MALRTFSVAGEALRFATARFETVLRVAAFPLVLVLIFDMAAAFGYLSVANDRFVTFHDVAAAGKTWADVVARAGEAAAQGLKSLNVPTWSIYVASVAVNGLLVASFMAPLIRYAGLGERPARGLLKAPFGPDQWRFLGASGVSFLISSIIVYGPIAVATLAILSIVSKAMSGNYADFPDTESLHTIDIMSAQDALTLRGEFWLYDYGYWSAAAAIVIVLFAIVLILHVRPRAEDRTAGIGFLGRMLGVVGGLVFFFGAILYVARVYSAAAGSPLEAHGAAIILFASAAAASALFLSLRLYPYAGVALCRRSMAFAGTFRVTRRYDVFRLLLIFVLLGLVLWLAQVLLIGIGVSSIRAVLGGLGLALESYVRLINKGEGGEWVAPLFQWLWAATSIVVTLLWTAFTYGVAAGLLGRLYRESAK